MDDLSALRNQLKSLADPAKAEHSKRFFKSGAGEYGEGDQFLGITVPNQRKVARQFKDISAEALSELFRSNFHEERLTAIFILVIKYQRADDEGKRRCVDFYIEHFDGVNNWDLVDSSCYHILGDYLLERDKNLLYQWARSDNLWQKRAAMISCYAFIRREHYADALLLAYELLDDEHDLIHKAVGWMLREVGNRDKPSELAFLKLHYDRMPRTMLRYAIEKFDSDERKTWLDGQV